MKYNKLSIDQISIFKYLTVHFQVFNTFMGELANFKFSPLQFLDSAQDWQQPKVWTFNYLSMITMKPRRVSKIKQKLLNWLFICTYGYFNRIKNWQFLRPDLWLFLLVFGKLKYHVTLTFRNWNKVWHSCYRMRINVPTGKKFVGDTVHAGYFSKHSVQTHINDAHHGAGTIDVRSVKPGISVDSGCCQKCSARTTARIGNSFTITDFTNCN